MLGRGVTSVDLQRLANGVLGLMSYTVAPDVTTSSMSVENSATSNPGLMMTQFGGGLTWSKSTPLYLEGNAAYSRYDPTFIASDGAEQRLEPVKCSPQMLSVSLSLHSPNWGITYVNPFEPELDDMRKRASVLGIDKLKIIQADITRPETIEGLSDFDYVFSCSVFEHIHPERGGDTAASANLGRLLKPGGLFVFSVPFYKKAFNEYVEGDAYSIKAASGQKTFFQRFYDEKTLQEQIIGPSGLKVFSKKFIGERFYHEGDITKRVAH